MVRASAGEVAFVLAKVKEGLSDPYCKIFLEDKAGKVDKSSKDKTVVVKKSLNPEWNHFYSRSAQEPSSTAKRST
jgi:hypothetical protein